MRVREGGDAEDEQGEKEGNDKENGVRKRRKGEEGGREGVCV